MPKKTLTPEQLEQIKTVVKNNTIDNHIDDQIGHKHGWGYAAIILLKEIETLTALMIEVDDSWDLCPVCKGWIHRDDCRYLNKLYPREKYPEKYDWEHEE